MHLHCHLPSKIQKHIQVHVQEMVFQCNICYQTIYTEIKFQDASAFKFISGRNEAQDVPKLSLNLVLNLICCVTLRKTILFLMCNFCYSTEILGNKTAEY